MSERLRLRSHGLEWREIEGEVVALDVPTSRYLRLNRTGALLWSSLAAGATREELLERLMERFDLDETKAAADLDAFLPGSGSDGSWDDGQAPQDRPADAPCAVVDAACSAPNAPRPQTPRDQQAGRFTPVPRLPDHAVRGVRPCSAVARTPVSIRSPRFHPDSLLPHTPPPDRGVARWHRAAVTTPDTSFAGFANARVWGSVVGSVAAAMGRGDTHSPDGAPE